ncbi:MAG: DUF4845 domain-containing protein [Pseudomonadota bacterium]
MKKQSGGVSFLQLCGVLAIGMAILLGVKAIPPYMNYWYVQAAVDSLYTDPPRTTDTNADVYRQIRRHLQDNAVYSLEPKDVVTITGRGNGRVYAINYSFEIPLFFNAALVFTFGEPEAGQEG